MNMDLFQAEIIPLQEGERTLACSCPKCSAKIELDLKQIVEKTFTNTCPACKARYELTKESFARRASRKAGEINCSYCGGLLDHSQYCPSCKALYPDYYAAEFPGAAKKRERLSRDLFGGLKSFSFEWHSSSAPSVDYKPVQMDSEPWEETASLNKKNLTLGVSAVVIVALVALGVTFYFNFKAKKQYAKTYVTALYGIKMGTDLGLKLCSKLSADWTVKSNSGQNTPPLISVDDEIQLNNVKAQTEMYLQKLNDPPSAFIESKEMLLKLNESFVKVHASALKPSGTISDFANLRQQTENDYKVASAAIKNNLPKELSAELEIAKAKYKGLNDF